MATKRKSDVIDLLDDDEPLDDSSIDGHSTKENDTPVGPAKKKARVSDASESACSSNTKGKGKADSTEETSAPKRWQDVDLESDPDTGVPVYDDCAEVRRKIRALTQTPGFKVTHWLKEIGGINSNSYGRFMKEKGRTDGASNGTYYAAYCYFEKIRILEGKKKTATRKRNETQYPQGFSLENRRYGWVLA